MQIVKFSADSALPAYLMDNAALLDINKEVVTGRAFPSLSIKGKQFTINRDGVKTVITKPDDAEEVAQSIGVVLLRANMHAKTFYGKRYVEGESDRARPTCYSYDGKAPSANSQEPQAKNCQACPHNQWGSRTGDGDKEGSKGKACQDKARIAVSTPDKLDPLLLSVPPASLKALREALKIVAARKVPYNAVVMKIGFDRDAPSPQLTFKPVGLMDDTGYAGVTAMYDDELVRAIVGLDDIALPEQAEKPTPRVDADELDAALAARAVSVKAKAKPAPADDEDDELPPPPKAKPVAKAKPAPAPLDDDEDDEAPAPKAAKPKAEPTPAPAKPAGAAGLLADLDDLLGSKDD